MRTHPCILTVAGSDSGGGAGIQADLKTMTVLGGFGMSVITALTAQNGLGVTGIHAPDTGFLRTQLRAVLDGFPVRAAKTGMLFSAPIIETVCAELHDRPFPLVVDPVCVSQSGHKLLRDDAVAALREVMIREADLLTPNKPEAELLSGVEIRSLDDLRSAAKTLLDLGARAVLIKGGHFDGEAGSDKTTLTDWLALPGQDVMALSHPRVDTINNHGTGCTLSAAIATFLGQGLDLADAVRRAQAYLDICLKHSYTPGKGVGPVNHAAPWEAD
ncbi:MAG TPA: bifunctional hydroxymethylpyrimidine kinase/phosphomethylpyrimidine kinase [Candidatus Avidesulfovibrio excrementigallinarum]|nr:bifunctional hydroxymethylpyrimidine kinase/phosphomethylpyrimidine kinase [Candidatus Avidesulfovibrio excrementigallinarum]